MAALVHLVRHAEVDNPGQLVYASMSGYGLSPHGLDQAKRIGRYLGPRPVVAIWSSPLERSLRTAEEIAARSAVPVRVDHGLAEWTLFDRWKGHRWTDIKEAFPGELEAYLDHPHSLSFADEPLDAVADRIADVARRLDEAHPHGDVVVVAHQHAIQAGKLRLIGSPLSDLHDDMPGTGAVVTLRPGPSWKVETVWEPGEAPRFGEKSDLRVVSSTGGPSEPTSA